MHYFIVVCYSVLSSWFCAPTIWTYSSCGFLFHQLYIIMVISTF